MAQETEELFARAEAAAKEAARLTQMNLHWQCHSYAILHRMQSRALFDGHAQRLIYPQDLPEPMRLPLPQFPKKADDS